MKVKKWIGQPLRIWRFDADTFTIDVSPLAGQSFLGWFRCPLSLAIEALPLLGVVCVLTITVERKASGTVVTVTAIRRQEM